MENKKQKTTHIEEDSLVPNPSDESSALILGTEQIKENGEICNNTAQKPKPTSSATTSLLTSETLLEQVQLLMDEMNLKRKNDENLISEFRKSLQMQTETWCGMLERSLTKTYEANNEACQEKLQQLYTILERINHLEQELMAFKENLKILYTDVESS